jgi:hypothetical protein
MEITSKDILDFPIKEGYYWNRIIEKNGEVRPWFISYVRKNKNRKFCWGKIGANEETLITITRPQSYSIQFVFAECPSF